MKYMLMICAGGEREAAPGRIGIEEWVNDTDGRGVRLLGDALQAPQSAVTVRVREGETLITDGPFAESKEFVAGFDIVECADLDEAVEVGARHPVAGFGAVEVRPFHSDFELSDRAREWARAYPPDSWALFVCVDGIPEADEVEAELTRGSRAWGERLEERGVMVVGAALAHADTATTIRVHGEETILSDGPFIETKEFIAGVAVLHGIDREEAIALAAAHPIAAHHMIEVRRFADQ